MRFYKINPDTDFDAVCERIGPSAAGRNLMRKKSRLNFIFIEDIGSPAANILKQDALSVGAELVTSRDTILGREEKSSALLIANDAQREILAKKEKAQDFGLKNLAEFLSANFTQNFTQKAQIMGVLNFNGDSFNEASRVENLASGVRRIEEMIEQGAEYIDIGGVSSRPGSLYCGREEEFRRIEPIVREIYRLNLHGRVKFSLDSFDAYCLEFALNHGFAMINDITADTALASLAARYDAELCMMHMKGDPATMQNEPHYEDLLGEIDEFFAAKIAEAAALGAKKLVLDVGIGFGKTAAHNMLLIKHLAHFTHFGYPLLVGASRKSVINFYSPSEVKDRLPGTLYLHLKAYENGAHIIRAHDVSEHKQLFDMHEAMKQTALW